jgi:hypothetical protein
MKFEERALLETPEEEATWLCMPSCTVGSCEQCWRVEVCATIP